MAAACRRMGRAGSRQKPMASAWSGFASASSSWAEWSKSTPARAEERRWWCDSHSAKGLVMSERIRVLIADDEPEVRAGVRRAIERSSRLTVVAEARDGAIAWAYLQQLRPDIAIIDIGMPKIDGIVLVRRIRQHKLPIDVILLTVCNEQRMFDTALELGVK